MSHAELPAHDSFDTGLIWITRKPCRDMKSFQKEHTTQIKSWIPFLSVQNQQIREHALAHTIALEVSAGFDSVLLHLVGKKPISNSNILHMRFSSDIKRGRAARKPQKQPFHSPLFLLHSPLFSQCNKQVPTLPNSNQWNWWNVRDTWKTAVKREAGCWWQARQRGKRVCLIEWSWDEDHLNVSWLKRVNL